jgi:LacI family transcriptional regulator
MDVAARAAVSMKTVSRVMNGEPHVRPHLKQRVTEAVEELGYRPNLAARQLAGNRSFLIAYLFSNASVSYTTAMLMAAALECRDLGYHLVAEPIDPDGDTAGMVRHALQRLRPDGVILTPPLSDDLEALSVIESSGIALVRIAGSVESYGTIIGIDSYRPCCALMHHLLDLGHRRIGMVAPPLTHSVAQRRYEAYVDSLSQAGIEIDPQLVARGDFAFRSGAAAAAHLLDVGNRPTAIFAANDGMALGVMSEAQRRGLRVPEDLAVAGFDDSPAGRMHWPPLTTVRQPLGEMARRAASLLIGKDVEDSSLDHVVLIRSSTDGTRQFAAEAMDA